MTGGILNPEESLRRAQELLRSGLEMAALEHFASAHERAPEDPRYRSHYGWAVAMVEHRVDRGVSLCRSALRDAADQPELYHNLARILLAHGRKNEAIKYIRRGLMVDPRNAALTLEWRRLGIRRPPVLSALPRGHVVNRLLGRLRGVFVRDHVAPRELAEAAP
ncbi:MAG: tetratricopeptide repeat protein [Deltaproteobacteria bacterium]|nr:tetratricopeptide repeat protein [Deltaproteobacteria bacterium]